MERASHGMLREWIWQSGIAKLSVTPFFHFQLALAPISLSHPGTVQKNAPRHTWFTAIRKDMYIILKDIITRRMTVPLASPPTSRKTVARAFLLPSSPKPRIAVLMLILGLDEVSQFDDVLPGNGSVGT
jgi:transposase InsO family protein